MRDRARARRRVRRRRLLAGAGVVLVVVAAFAFWPSQSPIKSGRTTTRGHLRGAAAVSARKHTAKRVVLVERPRGELGEPMQDAAAAALGRGRVLLLGGLTGSDVSSDAIVRVAGGSSRVIGRLPTPVHDTAAVRLGRFVYLFGGGTGTGQLDSIL